MKIIMITIITILLVVLLVGSGAMIVKEKVQDKKEEQQYEKMEKEYVNKNKKKNKIKGASDFDIEKMKKKNKDVVGWIECSDVLSYPLVKGMDNDYYLNHNALRQSNISGSIFLDYRTDFTSPNCIIYGHNMKGRQMFGKLLNFTDMSFAKKHDIFYIDDGTMKHQYKLVSVNLVSDTSRNYKISFNENDGEHDKWYRDILSTKYYHNDSGKLNSENVITLSTCYSNDASVKLVLHLARQW